MSSLGYRSNTELAAASEQAAMRDAIAANPPVGDMGLVPSGAATSDTVGGTVGANPPVPAPNLTIDLRNISRIYEPLGGDEVIEAITQHIKQALTNGGKFKPHIIYERIIWKFTLAAEWEGAANNTLMRTIEGGVELAGGAKELNEIKVFSGELARETGSIVESGAQVDTNRAPDEIRERTGQDIPVMARQGEAGSSKAVVTRVPASVLKGKR